MSSGKHRKEKDCLNCGHLIEDYYCSYCGQENIEIREDALHMISHTIADYFHFDSKFFGTIKPLLLQPGFLSKLYVSGKRVCFIHPIRLYIFISIVFFLVILSQDKVRPEKEGQNNLVTLETGKNKNNQDKIDAIQKQLDNPELSKKERDSLIKVMVQIFRSDKSKKNEFTINQDWISKTDTTVEAYENRQKTLPAKQQDNFMKHYVIRRALELQKYPNVSEKISEEILHNVPKMMFILLPLFALILKMVYFRSKKYYYEHLIYSFHVHSALFLSVLLLKGISKFFGLFYDLSEFIGFIWMLYILWYIYRSLRTFYGSKRWVTVAKFAFLMFSYLIVFSLSTMIVVAVTMMMI